jgi:PAS domain S-box-containing protein
MRIRLNITPKLTLVFVLFAALLLAGVSTLAYTSGRSALESAAVAELFSIAIEKQSSLNAWVTETMTHAASLSTSPYLHEIMSDFLTARALGDQAEIQTTHDRLVEELQIWAGDGMDYLEWMILDPQSGEVIASTNRSEEGKFREDQPYFINGKSGPYLQNVYYSASALGTLLTVSAPIRSENGALLGVLAGNLNLEKMNAIISRRTGLRQSDDAFLVNTSELVITQPRFINDPAVLQRGIHTEAVKRCLTRNSGVVTAPDYRGVPALIVYRWLPERQLCLIVKMDRAEALAPALALRNNIFFISILAMLLAAVLAYWLARTITRPIQQLAEAAQEIGTGKLTTRINVKTGDEIGQLAGMFVQMAENLQKTLVSRADLLNEVTERKKAEIALKETNEYLDNLFNYANAPIIVWDPQFKISRFNHAFEELTGKSAAEVLGKPLGILFPPAQIKASMEHIRKTLTGERWEVVEINIQHMNGSIHTVLWNSATLFSADGKIPIATIAQGQDITERNQAENMIEARLRLVEFATNHSLDEVLTKTLDEVCAMMESPIGFYHFVEHDQKTLSLQAWSTRTLQEYCKAEGKGLHYDVDQAGVWVDCIRQRKPVIHNDYASLPASRRKGLPEGHAALIRELVVPILREDWIVAILGVGNKAQEYTEKDVDIVAYFADVAWEIAERKRAEQRLATYTEGLEEMVDVRTRELREAQDQLVRQERLALMGQLAGSIGHELRNPLGVISNAIYYLKMAQPDANDTIREYLDIIEKETRTSDKIVTDLLDFTRIKSLDRQAVAVSELVRQSLERYPVPPSVELTLEMAPNLPPVYADPQHILQVLGNLTVNACQAMDNVGKLVISAAAQSDMIRIAVQDSGVGIPPENMKKLFEPLFTTKTKGIGLGLAVSRKLAEANGGRIEVQSEPDKGSTFTLYLPVYKESK